MTVYKNIILVQVKYEFTQKFIDLYINIYLILKI